MDFKQKLGYMCIGCLFTITGYIIASLGGGDTTHAQKDEQVLDKIVCRQLEVVNTEGRAVVRIHAHEDGGIMHVYNAAGRADVGIAATEDGGMMTVTNAIGKRDVSIGGPGLGVTFYSLYGEPAGSINGFHTDITFYNAAGKTMLAGIAATEDGGMMHVYNAAGKAVVGIAATEDGGMMTVNNAVEKTKTGIAADEDGGSLVIFNEAENAVVHIGAAEDGDGLIRTYENGWRTH